MDISIYYILNFYFCTRLIIFFFSFRFSFSVVFSLFLYTYILIHTIFFSPLIFNVNFYQICDFVDAHHIPNKDSLLSLQPRFFSLQFQSLHPQPITNLAYPLHITTCPFFFLFLFLFLPFIFSFPTHYLIFDHVYFIRD